MSLYVLQTSLETKRDKVLCFSPAARYSSACSCIYAIRGHGFRPLLRYEIYAAESTKQLRCVLVDSLRKIAKILTNKQTTTKEKLPMKKKMLYWHRSMHKVSSCCNHTFLKRCLMDVLIITGKTCSCPICAPSHAFENASNP